MRHLIDARGTTRTRIPLRYRLLVVGMLALVAAVTASTASAMRDKGGGGRSLAASTNVIDFRQCAQNEKTGSITGLGNCHWINGILQSANSKYFEGMVVPQRILVINIPAASGNIHTLTFHVNFTKGGIHAYDFLASYDQAVQTAKAFGIDLKLNPCGDELGPPSSMPATCNSLRGGANKLVVPIPDDGFISKDGAVKSRSDAFEAKYSSDRSLTIYGNQSIDETGVAQPLLITHTVANGGDTGDSDANYTLKWHSASDQILIEFGGHLAVGTDGTAESWGNHLGAGFINGGPYHFSLDLLDGSSLGNQDNQITSGDIISPATKMGQKFLDANLNNQKDSGESGLSGFVINAYKDADGNGSLSASEFAAGAVKSATTDASGNYAIGQLPPDKYIFCEVQQSGYVQTYPNPASHSECLNGSSTLGPAGWAVTLNEGDLDQGNDFGNGKPALKVTVSKSASPTSICNGTSTKITYTYTVGNDSSSNLNAQFTSIGDDKLGSLLAAFKTANGGSDTLAPGKSVTFTADGSISAATKNTVTVNASGSGGVTATASASADVSAATCSVDISKSVNPTSICNGTSTDVLYTFTVKNTGSVDLSGIKIVDDKLGDITADYTAAGGTDPLGAGKSVTFTHKASISAATDNKVTVTGSEQGVSVTASATASVTAKNCDNTSLAPTQTTCEQFESGNFTPFSSMTYGLKAGKINNVSPGVFFFYAEYNISGSPASLVVDAHETYHGGSPPTAASLGSDSNDWVVQQGQSILYSFANGVCTKLNATAVINGGQTKLTYSPVGGVPDGKYVLSVKYTNAASLIGSSPCPGVSGGNPTCYYGFTPSLNGSDLASRVQSMKFSKR